MQAQSIWSGVDFLINYFAKSQKCCNFARKYYYLTENENKMDRNLKEESSKLINKMRTSRLWKAVAFCACLLLVLLVAFCTGQSKRSNVSSGLPVAEAFDSLNAVLPKGSVVVGRFPDAERADLYYLNSGVLYCFNGKSKLLEEMAIAGVPSGSIVDAKLTQDEKYIMLTIRQGKLDKLYRLNTMNRNIVDMDKSTAVDEDVVVVEEKQVQPVEKKSEVPTINEPLPEAAFAEEPTGAGHEVKKEVAPETKSEPVNAPEVTTISTE